MLCWIDIETTGLNPDECHPLEIACVITTDTLEFVASNNCVIYSPVAANIVESYKYWCRETDKGRGGDPRSWAKLVQDRLHPRGAVDETVLEMHRLNGLWEDSIDGRALDTVDRDLSAFIVENAHEEEYVLAPGGTTSIAKKILPQLAGSTISFDRAFLAKHFPRTASESTLHYRNVDVTTLCETARRFWPDLYAARPKSENKAHRAMADIRESLDQYRYFVNRLGPK